MFHPSEFLCVEEMSLSRSDSALVFLSRCGFGKSLTTLFQDLAHSATKGLERVALKASSLKESLATSHDGVQLCSQTRARSLIQNSTFRVFISSRSFTMFSGPLPGMAFRYRKIVIPSVGVWWDSNSPCTFPSIVLVVCAWPRQVDIPPSLPRTVL